MKKYTTYEESVKIINEIALFNRDKAIFYVHLVHTFILHKRYVIIYNKRDGEECPKEGLDNE